MSKEELPAWANAINTTIEQIIEHMNSFKEEYSKVLKIRGSKTMDTWIQYLNEIKKTIINNTTPPRPIRYEELLENIKDKPYDGSYITLLDKDELVLRTFRIKIDPAEIRAIEPKEEPITVNMTKRYLEIVTDEKTYTKPAPKNIAVIHLIDGRSATVVR